MTIATLKAAPNMERLFCHGTLRAYTWILPNATLDDTHYGHLFCWGCLECGNSGTTVWGKVFMRETWQPFHIRTAQGKVQTEGYVLGNWALTPYADKTVLTYLPTGQRLPLHLPDWDSAIQTLRTLRRMLPKIEQSNSDPLRYLKNLCR